jgi:hypothetical protein
MELNVLRAQQLSFSRRGLGQTGLEGCKSCSAGVVVRKACPHGMAMIAQSIEKYKISG